MKYKSELLLLVLVFGLIVGCGEQSGPDPAAQDTSADIAKPPISVSAPQSDSLDARQIQMWSASCALCHVDGNAGAPIVGVAEHWQPRVTKGMENLLRHTVDGFNSMPPLGYCMACETEDFTAMIRFMSKGPNET
jgi:cytochrome c5